MELEGKYCLITGATKGFGFEIAQDFVQHGASVFICARSGDDVTSAKIALSKNIKDSSQKIDGTVCDMASLNDLEKLYKATINFHHNLDILVNNAGVYGPIGPLEKNDWQSWEAAIRTNLLGPIYLTKLFIEQFKINRAGKIINISGGGATSPMPGLSSYAVSKSGLVRFTETMAKELQEFQIDVNCVAPGALNTRLLDQVLDAGETLLDKAFINRMTEIKASGGTSLSLGASCVRFLASNKSDGITGRLISAVWDDWQNLHKNRDMLSKTDIYTLRRITAKDRDQSWGDLSVPNS